MPGSTSVTVRSSGSSSVAIALSVSRAITYVTAQSDGSSLVAATPGVMGLSIDTGAQIDGSSSVAVVLNVSRAGTSVTVQSDGSSLVAVALGVMPGSTNIAVQIDGGSSVAAALNVSRAGTPVAVRSSGSSSTAIVVRSVRTITYVTVQSSGSSSVAVALRVVRAVTVRSDGSSSVSAALEVIKPPSGAFKFLGQFYLSPATQLIIDNTYLVPLYANYFLTWDLSFSTQGSILIMHTSGDNGATFDETATDYVFGYRGTNASSSRTSIINSFGLGLNETKIRLGHSGFSNNLGHSQTGNGLLVNLREASETAMGRVESQGRYGDGTSSSGVHGGYVRRSTAVVDALRIKPSAGTFSGVVLIYGLNDIRGV